MMELNLTRVDYLQVGLTSQKCMKLLPSAGDKSQQKVVVADNEGVVQVFGIKKGEVQLVFKTLPGSGIKCVELGGTVGTVKDKIFVASGKEVRGYTKKGKLFLGFDTNMTEPMNIIRVSGSDLMCAGTYVYNHFHDCVDINYVVSGDQIQDVISLPPEKARGSRNLVPVLALKDRTMKVLKGSEILYSVEVAGIPTCLHLFYNDGGENGDLILYGTSDGKIGLVEIGRKSGTHKWLLESETYNGGIVCMDNYDITGDGVRDLIVGRDDGTIQVYTYDEGEESAPSLRYTYTCSESITSIQGGVVGNAGYDEIIATTYSGWLFGLTTEAMEKNVSVSAGVLTMSQDSKQKIGRLKAELEELHQKVLRDREKYQANTQSKAGGMSAIPFFSINDKMALSKQDASYLLTLEVQSPIDNVLIQSDVPVDLLDVEKNSAVVSYSACDPDSGNYLLATYRCQANTTRLEVKIRTIEGQYGTIQAYVTPCLQPKCCQVRQYKVKPLSLHMRTHAFDPNRPYNTLTLRGPFSLAEIHTWVVFCLPEVPERTPGEDTVTFTFISTFLDTMLHACYGKGEAIFKSDNISTISILKDVLTKEATKKKIKLEILCDVNEDSVIHTLHLLHPKLDAQILLSKQVSLIDALRDLQAHEPDTSFLTPEYRQILENAAALQSEFCKQPSHLERLYGMITDLYIDKHKFKGVNVKNRIPQLLEILNKYNFENLLNFFHQSS